MAGSPHEEHDREDPEVRFARLEQSIVALTEMVTQLLVMKGKEANTMTQSILVNSPYNIFSQETFCDFEKHTRGIGSKVTRQMGYDGQGIQIPIIAQQRPKHEGLGFSGQESNTNATQTTFIKARGTRK
jgi:hypothetical protein